jgi:EAL domain-containing protein (putative c-di-GMP-specific phosphodiesterase class I)
MHFLHTDTLTRLPNREKLLMDLGQASSGPVAFSVTRGIQRFASGLGIQTVAEYVHSAAILEKIRSLNIDFAQGYHVGEPSATPITDPGSRQVAARLLQFQRKPSRRARRPRPVGG